jgi:hypothetical protein
VIIRLNGVIVIIIIAVVVVVVKVVVMATTATIVVGTVIEALQCRFGRLINDGPCSFFVDRSIEGAQDRVKADCLARFVQFDSKLGRHRHESFAASGGGGHLG